MSQTAEAPKALKKSAGKRAGSGAGTLPSKRANLSAELFGREPRVDLLPGEVHVGRRERALARRAWIGVVVIGSIVVLGIAGAFLDALQSATALADAQNQTTSLLAQQGKYAEVRTIEGRANLLEAAQSVGGAPEIDWAESLTSLQDALPSGTTITDLTITSAGPVEEYAQSTAPLQGARVGTLQVTLSTPQIPSVPTWTEALSKLKGYVDSNIDSVTRDQDSGNYTAVVTLHVNEKAFDGKYTKGTDK